MNHVPPGQEPTENVDDRYRRASASDPSRPSEAVRRSVLAHATRLAAQRAAHRTRWRPAVLGTLAAAGLAGLVIAPQFLAPRAPQVAEPPAGAQAAYDPAVEHVTPAPAVTPEIAAAPPESARSVNPPSRAARVRPKANEATAPLAAQSTALAPPAGRQAADAGAVAGGFPARQLRAPGSPSAVASMAAATRIGAESAAALRHAAEVGDLATLAALVAKQTDIDSRDGAGRTALMIATLHGQADAVTTLLAHGADPDAADAAGTTPLQAATAGDYPAIVAVLRGYGAR
ncbi:MAG TPA: ankyrin repeat domain-containing protein [Steroidobacteraceae bacterium]